MIGDYLKLGRAQTAAVEGAGFPLAAFLGGAPLWALPLFALLGILSHLGGFGENGITDLKYDRADPAKATHPLVTGQLPLPRGVAFVVGCQAAGLVLFFGVLGTLGRTWTPLAAGAFLGYIALGHAYNFLGKRWKVGAVLEISGAFALAFMACGTSWTGHPNALIWGVTLYAGLMVAFQIGIAGELKELGQLGERNLLRKLGAAIIPKPTWGGGPYFHAPRPVWALSWVLTTGKALALGIVGDLAFGPFWGVGAFTLGFAVLTLYQYRLLHSGGWDRSSKLHVMGMGEATSYLLLVVAVGPVLGIAVGAAFAILPVLWYVAMNRALWIGTASSWAPGV